jgi:hypothetical protein
MTAETKHTPWRVRTRTFFPSEVLVSVETADGELIVDLPQGPKAKERGDLIAAAPDMLAALKARRLAREEAAALSAGFPDGERIPAHLAAGVEALFAKAEALEVAALALYIGS